MSETTAQAAVGEDFTAGLRSGPWPRLWYGPGDVRVAEILIDRWLGFPGTYGSWPLGEILTPWTLVGQIDAARRAGARALFVVLSPAPGLECTVNGALVPGGHVLAALEVYRALRRFSTEVGPVVAFGEKLIGSCAPWLMLAADVVVLEPRARLLFHSCCPDESRVPPGHSGREWGNEVQATVLRARSTVREKFIGEWATFVDGKGLARVLAEDAPGLGLADFVGDELHARAGALLLAVEGLGCVESRRRAALAGRPEAVFPPEPREAAVATCTIKTHHLAADAVQTSNYAEDGSGVPVTGAKLDHTGQALKVAPGSVQIGIACTVESGSAAPSFTNRGGFASASIETSADGFRVLRLDFARSFDRPYQVVATIWNDDGQAHPNNYSLALKTETALAGRCRLQLVSGTTRLHFDDASHNRIWAVTVVAFW